MDMMDRGKLPGHIAIIMDGNGRWAQKRYLNRIRGHRRGINVARDIVRLCREWGIGCLTLYAFSRENWQRPALEVKALMKLLEIYLKDELPSLMENNIRFRAIGSIGELPEGVQKIVAETERATGENSGMVLQLALSYSGREELVGAAKALAEAVARGALKIDDISEETFGDHLYTAGIPDPDLLIRTSGEMRVSNFLLWQLAYTEIYVTDVLWPDFTKEDMIEALVNYQKRERRFGLTGSHQAVGHLN